MRFYKVSVHLLEKWRHFVSPKTFLRFRVRVRVRVRAVFQLKYVFCQTCFRASAVDPFYNLQLLRFTQYKKIFMKIFLRFWGQETWLCYLWFVIF